MAAPPPSSPAALPSLDLLRALPQTPVDPRGFYCLDTSSSPPALRFDDAAARRSLRTVLLFTLLEAAVLSTLWFVIWRFGGPGFPTEVRLLFAILTLLCTLLFGAALLYRLSQIRRARAAGPWLKIDAPARHVELPRHNLRIPFDALEWSVVLRLVHTKGGTAWLSYLVLTLHAGPDRFPLTLTQRPSKRALCDLDAMGTALAAATRPPLARRGYLVASDGSILAPETAAQH